jgi:hypothetical protein
MFQRNNDKSKSFFFFCTTEYRIIHAVHLILVLLGEGYKLWSSSLCHLDCSYFSLRSRYSPQDPVLKHLTSETKFRNEKVPNLKEEKRRENVYKIHNWIMQWESYWRHDRPATSPTLLLNGLVYQCRQLAVYLNSLIKRQGPGNDVWEVDWLPSVSFTPLGKDARLGCPRADLRALRRETSLFLPGIEPWYPRRPTRNRVPTMYN